MKHFKLLIISTDGPLVTMLATPLLKALNEIVQNGLIDAVTSERISTDILSVNKLCNDIMVMEPGVTKGARLLKRLRNRRYTHSITLFPCAAFKTNILAFASGARRRIAHTPTGRPPLSFRLLSNIHIPERPGIHAIKQNLNIVSVFDPLFQIESENPFLELNPKHRLNAQKFITENKLQDESIVGIYPGAAGQNQDSVADIRWPAKSYATICNRLIEEKKKRIILFDSPDEPEGAVDKIRQMTKNHSKILVHRDISALNIAALIEKCSIFITNDNVFEHIGAALRIPTLSIFGPTDPAITGAVGSHSYLARNNAACPACAAGTRKKPRVNHTCLEDLKPAEIWKTMESLVEI